MLLVGTLRGRCFEPVELRCHAECVAVKSNIPILPSGSYLSPQVQQLFEQLLSGGDDSSVTSVLGRC